MKTAPKYTCRRRVKGRVGKHHGLAAIRTLDEVGHILGCSYEHVRRIENVALAKLRAGLQDIAIDRGWGK